MRALVQALVAGPVALILLLALICAHQPYTAQAFTGGTGGFSLSELPEELFDEDGTSTTSSTTDFSDLSMRSHKLSARASGSRGSGQASHASWETLRTQGHKALVPSLVTAATVAVGATGRVLQKRYGSTMTRMWQEHQEARRLRLEKRLLEREIKEEQRRYQQEMRRMTEEQERDESEATAVAKAEFEAEEELRRMRLRVTGSMTAEKDELAQQQQQQQQQDQLSQRYRPDLKKTYNNQKARQGRLADDLQETVAELEAKVQALQGEVESKTDMASRAQSSRVEELNNARVVIDQLRKEVEEARGAKEHMQGELRQYQVRLQALKDQEKNGSGSLSEDDTQRLRADIEAQLRQEYAHSRAQERNAWAKEVRHQTVADISAQSKAERSKYEADLVDLYRRRLKEEVAKRDVVMAERLHAQDIEYRRQCEELRMKVQGLLRDRDQHMKEKVALHAREWRERVGSPGANMNKDVKQQQQQQQQQNPAPQPHVRSSSGGGGDGGLFRRKGAASSSSFSKVVRGGGGGVRGSASDVPSHLHYSEIGDEEGVGAVLMDAEEAESRAVTLAVGTSEEEGKVRRNEEVEERRRRRLKMLQRQRGDRSAAETGVDARRDDGSVSESSRRYSSLTRSRRERV
ncbi:Hypothetical protein NocV09_01001690 [Nannochloropsis oceanica]